MVRQRSSSQPASSGAKLHLATHSALSLVGGSSHAFSFVFFTLLVNPKVKL